MHAVLAAFQTAELCALAGVDRSTAIRWKNGTSRCPPAVVKLAQLRILGDAAALLGADWDGFTFGRDGLLYADGWRRGFSAGEIRAMPYVYGELFVRRTEAAQLTLALRAQQPAGTGALARLADEIEHASDQQPILPAHASVLSA